MPESNSYEPPPSAGRPGCVCYARCRRLLVRWNRRWRWHRQGACRTTASGTCHQRGSGGRDILAGTRGGSQGRGLRSGREQRVHGENQILSYYGNPYVPAMGILGELEPEQLVLRSRRIRASIDALNGARGVQPALHMSTRLLSRSRARTGGIFSTWTGARCSGTSTWRARMTCWYSWTSRWVCSDRGDRGAKTYSSTWSRRTSTRRWTLSSRCCRARSREGRRDDGCS